MLYRIFHIYRENLYKTIHHIYFRSQFKKSHEQLHFKIILRHIKHYLSVMFYYR